MHSHTKEFI